MANWIYIHLSAQGEEILEPQWTKHFINQELIQNFGLLNSAHVDILKWNTEENNGIIRVLDKVPVSLVLSSKFKIIAKSHCLSSLLPVM